MRLLKTLFKRILFISILILLFAVGGFFYFTSSNATINKNTLSFQQSLEIKNTIDTFNNRYHINGQVYVIEFTEAQLQTALIFSLIQTFKNTDTRSTLLLNQDSIDLSIEHPIDLYFTTRYIPVKFSIKLNNFQTPIDSIEIKHHVFPIFTKNFFNKKITNHIQQQGLESILTKENIFLTVLDSTLIIKYTWNERLSNSLNQSNNHTNTQITNIYITFQNQLKTMGNSKSSLQQAMLVLFNLTNQLKHPSDRIVFWSVLFASVDTAQANRLLNLNLNSPSVKLTLQNRYDLAKHFIYSAFLEQIGGSNFSEYMGEVKENNDATTRATKFSYSDVMANQAGIVFSDVLFNKIKSNQQGDFFINVSTSKLTLEDDLFEDGIEAPAKSKQSFEIELIKQALWKLPIYQ
ncbi:hypothetical protein [Marinicellulosiphila megalodicopiae]|uniref:hypothetical protein n=1 Tax=Marinicellulosiphila megalodicopiae TaxID=2724896 RepID=UPI003BAF1F37